MSTKINFQNRCRTTFPFSPDETFAAMRGVGDKIALTVTIVTRDTTTMGASAIESKLR